MENGVLKRWVGDTERQRERVRRYPKFCVLHLSNALLTRSEDFGYRSDDADVREKDSLLRPLEDNIDAIC